MKVKIYYMKKDFFSTGILDSDRVSMKFLPVTHKMIAEFDEDNIQVLDDVYTRMNLFEELPKELSEAQRSKVVAHTSMSVGDVVRTENGCYVVENSGWRKL